MDNRFFEQPVLNSPYEYPAQQYDPTPIINELRRHVDQWRILSNPNDWQVTPETARLLQHWRHHKFSDIRSFTCQVETETTVMNISSAPMNPYQSLKVEINQDTGTRCTATCRDRSANPNPSGSP